MLNRPPELNHHLFTFLALNDLSLFAQVNKTSHLEMENYIRFKFKQDFGSDVPADAVPILHYRKLYRQIQSEVDRQQHWLSKYIDIVPINCFKPRKRDYSSLDELNALLNGLKEIIKDLPDKQENDTTTNMSESRLDFLLKLKRVDTTELCKRKDTLEHILIRICGADSHESLRLILNKLPGITTFIPLSFLLLHACANLSLNVIKLLVELGANVNNTDYVIREEDTNYLYSPLQMAVSYSFTMMLQASDYKQVQWTQKADDGCVLLGANYVASVAEVINYLLAHGADPKLKNNYLTNDVNVCPNANNKAFSFLDYCKDDAMSSQIIDYLYADRETKNGIRALLKDLAVKCDIKTDLYRKSLLRL